MRGECYRGTQWWIMRTKDLGNFTFHFYDFDFIDLMEF